MQVWVSQWAAWAPGIASAQQWSAFDPEQLPTGDDMPPAAGVPAMTRRRLTRWGRQALEVADTMAGALGGDTPVIFSSRHGDTARTYKLLESLARAEALSPNAFSLSVHNSALGLFSILHQVKAPTLALAAGRDTLAAAWMEAASWLSDGSSQVLLVHTEEPLAEFYQRYADERDMPAALALLLTAGPASGAVPVELSMSPARGPASANALSVDFLHWWGGSEPALEVTTDQHSWRWSRALAVA
ncbi:beta-ketoacyl synthase chain length factor [Gilvimarinus algae]|uniref:Beta-ketoacyl synthase chain length factor n=1 Tax=Gilvimarinus algae TaxID=3058037 RepID=A0ABT8TIP8_9GAMM|nr:beta-ketoacyl synthase chain length factor [Gilvimarinus sp. SDUM040014]MDO3383455.1 beta-ketoacyl synthase chain length factor [Gilvimarinus sp. SDUM040014]